MNRLFTFFLCVFLGLSIQLNAQFSTSDVTFWVGTGSQQAVLVIDFNDSLANECLAWGYRFDDTVTAEQMLSDIATADPGLDVVMASGFLNDIVYVDHSGLAGLPDYWMTFSGSENSTWIMNMGIGTEINDGDWFGCSYTGVDTAWNPLFVPENPVAASQPFGINDKLNMELTVFPNPCTSTLNIQLPTEEPAKYNLLDAQGRTVLNGLFQTESRIDLSDLPTGLYFIQIGLSGQRISYPVNKQ